MAQDVTKFRGVLGSVALGFVLLAGTFIVTRPTASLLYAEATPHPASSQEKRAVPAGCGVHRVKRVFVGFSGDMDLDYFESAALQAEHILRAAAPQLCAAWSDGAASRTVLDETLRAALSAHTTVRITDVLFASQKLRNASVRLRSDAAAAPAQAWLAHFARHDDAWQVVSVARDRSAPAP